MVLFLSFVKCEMVTVLIFLMSPPYCAPNCHPHRVEGDVFFLQGGDQANGGRGGTDDCLHPCNHHLHLYNCGAPSSWHKKGNQISVFTRNPPYATKNLSFSLMFSRFVGRTKLFVKQQHVGCGLGRNVVQSGREMHLFHHCRVFVLFDCVQSSFTTNRCDLSP